MHTNCLSKQAAELLPDLEVALKSYTFVLAGGTALALHLGHRLSVDLDFFTKQTFSPDRLFRCLKDNNFSPTVLLEDRETLSIVVEGAKVSFFHYPYPFIDPFTTWKKIPIAGIVDIAAMKIIAILQRGAKRDFVDLYFILQAVPFRAVALRVIERFGFERINPVSIGKSLVYFADADPDPDPAYVQQNPPEWGEIKQFFKDNVKQAVIDLQQVKDGSRER